MRKQHLEDKIVKMYCERMNLREIARVLDINYKTVYRYFLKAAYKAQTANLKALDNKE